MNKKLLTIIIPTLNRGQMILKRMEELNMLKDNLKKEVEIIIINDGGEEIKFLIGDLKTKIIINKKNMGRGISILKGIEMADAKYISIFDDDDEIYVKNLEYVIEKLQFDSEESKGYIFRTSASKTSEYKNGQILNYKTFRHSKQSPGDHKEFVPLFAVKKVINFFYRSRRLPTSLIYFDVDQYLKWEYHNYEIVKKEYLEGGMTNKLRSKPIKKYASIAYIYYSVKYVLYKIKSVI